MSDAAIQNSKGSTGSGRALLFMVLMAYYWLTLTPFANLAVSSAADPWAGNSNLLNQVIGILLFAVLATFAMRHPLAQEVMRPRWLLISILIWFALTAVMADEPVAALRRVVLAAMVVFTASVILLLPRDEKHFAKLLGLALLGLMGLAYFGVLAMPGRSIHQASDVLEPLLAGDWRGFFNHKNVAAPAMAFTIFAGMFVWARWSKLVGALLVVGGAIFLFNTGGKTSLGMLPLVLVAAWVFENVRGTRVLLALGGVVAFNVIAVGSAVWEPVHSFVSGLGIDASFTDRVDIWRLAFSSIAERPWTGYGLSGFWQTEALVYGGGSVETWAVTAANAHNAYLEVAMAAGLPALVLVVLWLVIGPVRDSSVAFASSNDRALTRLYTRIWLYGLYASCVESFFFANSGPIWITILIGVFGLRYQRRTQLVTASAPMPSGVAYA